MLIKIKSIMQKDSISRISMLGGKQYGEVLINTRIRSLVEIIITQRSKQMLESGRWYF